MHDDMTSLVERDCDNSSSNDITTGKTSYDEEIDDNGIPSLIDRHDNSTSDTKQEKGQAKVPK